jgi:mono/diheme cytochrome c family protein
MKTSHVLAIATLAACLPNPVHDRAVEALGPETTNGASGFHRAGQPCATCHGAFGPATSDFSVAGTIFAGAGPSLVGVEGATIELVDSRGTSPPVGKPVVTNCVGNFWVQRADWDPTLPVRVKVKKGDVEKTMDGVIGRAASCADCHQVHPASALTKVGPIIMFDGEDPAGRPKNCPVDPEPR